MAVNKPNPETNAPPNLDDEVFEPSLTPDQVSDAPPHTNQEPQNKPDQKQKTKQIRLALSKSKAKFSSGSLQANPNPTNNEIEAPVFTEITKDPNPPTSKTPKSEPKSEPQSGPQSGVAARTGPVSSYRPISLDRPERFENENHTTEDEFYETSQPSLPSQPNETTKQSRRAKRKKKGLSPKLTALFGGIFGLACIATFFAVAIHVDHRPKPSGPAAAATASSVFGSAPSAKHEEPKTEEKTDPGPWRISALSDDGSFKIISGKIGAKSLIDALTDDHVPKAQIARILKSFDDTKRFDKPRKHDSYVVAIDKSTKRVKAFEFQASPTDVWQARENDEGKLQGTKLELKVEQHRVAKAFVVKDDLKSAVIQAGFDGHLLDSLDDALEDRLPLSSLQKGVAVRIVVQEQTVSGKFSKYTDIEAIEYTLARKNAHPTRLYHFRGQKVRGYFDAKGKAPSKGGWRAPVKFPRVTSRFNPKRMHPVLHVVMPHNGCDFGAPTGTQVFAASAGTIEFIGPAGPSGNLVLIAHAGGLQTGYAHLSKFASGIKVGDKVETRQLVGYVGSTGRSTGPHLHFSLKKNGQFADPLTLKLDGDRVLPKGERETFDTFRTEMDKILDSIPLPDRPAPTDAPDNNDDSGDNHGDHDNDDDKPKKPEKTDEPAEQKPQNNDKSEKTDKANKPAPNDIPTPEGPVDSAVWKPDLNQNFV